MMSFAFAGAAWSAVKGACSFIKDHKKAFLVSLVLIGCALFIGSWQMRGAKIERQKEEKATIQLKLDNANLRHKAELEACGEKINEIEEVHAGAIRKADARASRVAADLVAVTEEADRARRSSLQTRAEVAASIRRAETAEEQIDVFLKAVQSRMGQ